MKNKVKLPILIALFFLGMACRKAGTGGDASITGKVLHHETIIPNARVFIKYDQTEFPGVDTLKYDDVAKADNQGNYSFSGLKRGKYFLYGVGKDGVANGNPFDVYGGSRIDINSKTEIVQFNVAVTED